VTSRNRIEVRTGLLVGVVLAALGAPLGVIWALSVPDLAVVHGGSGHGYLLPVATEDRAGAAGDLVMVLILLVAGVLAGALVSGLCRRTLVGSAVGLLLGGALGGAIALAVGHVLVHGDYGPVYAHSADYSTAFQVRPYIRGTVDLVMFPLTALVVYGAVQLLRAIMTPAPSFPPPAMQAGRPS
jgi:hypothetical protein